MPYRDGSLGRLWPVVLTPLLPMVKAQAQVEIVNLFPGREAVAVAPQGSVVVTFGRPVDPPTVTAQNLKVFGRWSGVMSGSMALAADSLTLVFTPARPFQSGEQVTVSLTRDLLHAGQTEGRSGFSWTFWIATEPGSLDLTAVGSVDVRRAREGWVQSYGAYAGDLNGDGFTDLAVPNERANDVRVFLNDGSGGYDDFMVLPIPNGAVPSPNEGGDFNNDGLVDFAVGNAGSDLVSVYLGGGDGSLSHGGNFRADRGVRGVCVVDLDGDGFSDIVTANNRGGGTGNVSVLLNDGNGGFAARTPHQANARGQKTCATGDINRDGQLDVFVGAFLTKEILVYLGDGTGGLEFSGAVTAGGSPWMIVAGDLNGDGIIDVASANRRESNAAVLYGTAEGTLAPPVTYSVGREPLAIDLGDLDGDGALDVVTSDFAGATFTVLENDGSGGLVRPRTLAATTAGSCAILHDRDGDGDLDITGIDEMADVVLLFENR